ncbi:MAG: protoporphyrinogen oxidase [Terriglobales bacterium]
MKRVAIVGGGIAGLSAAFYLEQYRRFGAELGYVLYEASPRLGGVIRTERTADRFLVEAGPDSFLSEKPWVRELCSDLGIEDRLIGSNDAARQTWVWLRGRLHPLPDGLQFLVPTRLRPILTTGLFSWRTKLRIAAEYFQAPRAAASDESAAAFVERHFGHELVERLADPLLAGVYGGTAARLSARAVLSRMVALEEQHGSLARGLLQEHKQSPERKAQGPIFTTLRSGMQELVDAVGARLTPAAVRKGAAVRRVSRGAFGWSVHSSLGEDRFDSIVLAVPAHTAAEMLSETSAKLSASLEQIPYSSSVTVALAYDAAQVAAGGRTLPAGFGVLVPRTEGKRLLACTLVHNKFAGRVPEGGLLLRAFLGGSTDEAAVELSDEGVLRVVRQELREILDLEAEPLFALISRWPRSMAQYEIGHLERVAEIERLRQTLPGLHLIGNAYGGIGVPDCVRAGKEAATAVLD